MDTGPLFTKRTGVLPQDIVLKVPDWLFWCSYRSVIWLASRQRCCRFACQIAEWLEKYKLESASRLQEILWQDVRPLSE